MNGRCRNCGGSSTPGPERDPQPCCVNNTRMVVYKEMFDRYRLAGPGPWFRCNTCARCHGRPITGLGDGT